MATNVFANITARGTKGKFLERLQSIDPIWRGLVTEIPSDAPDERHVWIGMLPNPREFISGRSFVGISDFTYTVANETYELTSKVDRTSMEDDRHGFVDQVIRTMADVWAIFKEVQMAALFNNGGTSGNNSFDGVTFFNDTHTIGASTSDNNLASTAPGDAEALTVAEMKTVLRSLKLALQGFQDDTGREAYNWAALSNTAVMGNQQFEQVLTEVINSTLTGGGDSNPFFNQFANLIVNPYLGVTNDFLYLMALGDTERMPFIYQERTPLEIEVMNDRTDIAEHDGMIIMARQRYRLAYGEPRRIVKIALT